MTVKAGSIITVAGHTVVQRLQSQGLGDVRIPMNTIREIGNNLVVDKVPGEPEFTFSMESLSVDNSIEAILHGKVATGSGVNQGAGQADATGTEYKWEECQQLTIVSPWKDPQSFGSGNVVAGHLIPGYFPSKIAYKFGVTENASITTELRGGTFFYGQFAPTEDVIVGSGTVAAYQTAEAAVHYRRGGLGGTVFQAVLMVLVNGVQMVEGEDYALAGGGDGGPGEPGMQATVTFPDGVIKDGDQIRIAYFTTGSHSYPDAVHESALTMPGAVRGRNICVSAKVKGTWQRLYGVQTITLDATFDSTPERELCNDEIVGFTVNGTDCTGTVTAHAKDANAFFALIGDITGLDTTKEVIGFLNLNPLPIKIEIMDPRNAGTVLKTLYVPDAIFDIPGTPARVNAVVDFSLAYNSIKGTYSSFKGAASGI